MKNVNIKRILVPIDFSGNSETARANAMILADLLKAEVFMLCVIEDNWNHFAKLIEAQTVPITLSDIEKAINEKMNEIKESTNKKFGIVPKTFVVSGQIHKEIISFSEKKNIDLIVMGTHGTSGYNEYFMGSNAQRVVTLSKIPVLTMQKKCNKAMFNNILIPIDNSTHSREKVNIAIIFGKLFGATMHVLGLPDSRETLELKKFKTKIESVEEVLGSHDLKEKTALVQGENLAQSAIDYATRNKCDMIIINTGHESKINEYFMGVFAQQIVNNSKIPILSIKHSKTNYRIDAPGSPYF